MTTPWQVEWFTVASGPHEGQRRISGWLHTAIAGRSFGICPVCFAVVPGGGVAGNATGDLTAAHEQWHAGNGFPDPGQDGAEG